MEDGGEATATHGTTAEFAWLAEAKRYLLAAETLRNSDEYQRRPLLRTPTLFVLAHGIELFLKAMLVRNGVPEGELPRTHNLRELWQEPANSEIRNEILAAAREEWEAARINPRWVDDFSHFSVTTFEENLDVLSQLSTRETDFSIRYPAGRRPDTKGPRPHLLSGVFYRIVDRYARDLLNGAT